VLGRSFTFETLRAVSGRSEEESVIALEELVARGLLVESAENPRAPESYDFSHDKLRAVVYEEATLVRRRLLHRRAAESLQRQRDGARTSAAVVAHHLLEAGDEEVAAEQFKLAGDHARGLFANAEALVHYETALGLGHPDVGALQVAVGDLQTLRGDYRAALSAYESAAARPTGTDMVTIEHRIAMVHHRRGDWAAADAYLTSALGSLPETDGEALRARLTSDRSLTAHRAGRSTEARRLAEEALHLADGAGDRRSLAQAHNILGVIANGRRDFDGAAEHLEVSLELADALGEPGGRVAALNNLSLTCRARGDLGTALSLAEQALESCKAQGDRHREAALHNNVADLLHAVGDMEGSMTHLKAAVAIFAEIGEAQHPQPEIWKLFEW
jgi:tetratricopeptide (TPR) repeat protein